MVCDEMFRNNILQMWPVGERGSHHGISVKNTFLWKAAGNLRKYSSFQKCQRYQDEQEIGNVDNSLQLKLLYLMWRKKTLGVGGVTDWHTRNWFCHSPSGTWSSSPYTNELRLPPLQTQKANVSSLFLTWGTLVSCLCAFPRSDSQRTPLECDRWKMAECKEESAIAELRWSRLGPLPAPLRGTEEE